MWIRMAPPARTSTSHTGFVKSCGPHQRASNFGSVHALKTSASGASYTRVMVSTGYRETSVSAVIARSFLKVLEKIVEAIEPRIPEAAIIFEPACSRPQRLAIDPARAPLRRPGARDEPRALE